MFVYFQFKWLFEQSPHILNTSTRMMLAALTSLLFSILIGPKFIKLLYFFKLGQPIRTKECPELGKLHHKKQDTPTMGGILILASMLFSMFLWMDFSQPFTLILLITTLFFGIIGGYDDYLKLKHKNSKGLSAKRKILAQLIFSLAIALYLTVPGFAEYFGSPVVKEVILKENMPIQVKTLPLSEISNRLYIPFFKEPLILFSGAFSLLSILFILCVITGSSNAVNLTDGLDGLAAGCLIMASIFLLSLLLYPIILILPDT